MSGLQRLWEPQGLRANWKVWFPHILLLYSDSQKLPVLGNADHGSSPLESMPRCGLPNFTPFLSLFGVWYQGFLLLPVGSIYHLLASLLPLCLDKEGRNPGTFLGSCSIWALRGHHWAQGCRTLPGASLCSLPAVDLLFSLPVGGFSEN